MCHPCPTRRLYEASRVATRTDPDSIRTVTLRTGVIKSGRGLLLVEALSMHWGTTGGDPYSQTVWSEVALR